MPAKIVVREMGQSVIEATVARWVKKEGDPVRVGDFNAKGTARTTPAPKAEFLPSRNQPAGMASCSVEIYTLAKISTFATLGPCGRVTLPEFRPSLP